MQVLDNLSFFVACVKNSVPAIRSLLAKGVHPSIQNNHGLYVAAVNKSWDVVRLLLADARVNSACWDNVAMCMAAQHCVVDVLDTLLQRHGPCKGAALAAAAGGQRNILSAILTEQQWVLPCAVAGAAHVGIIALLLEKYAGNALEIVSAVQSRDVAAQLLAKGKVVGHAALALAEKFQLHDTMRWSPGRKAWLGAAAGAAAG